jgi:hypothetical protein
MVNKPTRVILDVKFLSRSSALGACVRLLSLIGGRVMPALEKRIFGLASHVNVCEEEERG